MKLFTTSAGDYNVVLFFNATLSVPKSVEPEGDWILETGSWDDNGVWKDDSTWDDGV